MRRFVIDEKGVILFDGRHQGCVNYITNNPHLDDIETVTENEYLRRFLNRFKCEVCKESFDLKRQRECKYCSKVTCEYCLNEDGICSKCEED